MSSDERREASRRNLTIRAELAEIDAARSFLRQTLAPFRLDEEDRAALERIAARMDCDRGAVLRQLIRPEWIESLAGRNTILGNLAG